MTLTQEELRRVLAVLDAGRSVGIVELTRLAGLPPQRAFCWAILKGGNFRNQDLTGFDFTGADFAAADVRGANLARATGLDQASLAGVNDDTDTRWPPGLRRIGTMVLIRAGEFLRGASVKEEKREKVPKEIRGWALPQRKVTIAQDFLLGRYAVTRGEFARFIAESGYDIPKGAFAYVASKGWQQSESHDWRDPGFPQDDRHPVVCVNHADATEYARWLSGKTGRDYRLPTEAEWEYAARAGTTTARFWGDDRDGARRHGNVADRSLMREMSGQYDPERFFDWDDGFPFTAPVGSFQPNQFGLYDMLGNVWEWTQDHWHENYKGAPSDGSAWTTPGSGTNEGLRVLRGGAWDGDPWNVRAGTRSRNHGGDRDTGTGFRLARTL